MESASVFMVKMHVALFPAFAVDSHSSFGFAAHPYEGNLLQSAIIALEV